MLTWPRALALGALVTLAGCLGPGGDTAGEDAEDCLLGGPPREEPAPGREAFNLTDAHLERYPSLGTVFEEPAHVVSVTCPAGLALLENLSDEGADVLFLDQQRGHNVYLTHNATTLHVTLTEMV